MFYKGRYGGRMPFFILRGQHNFVLSLIREEHLQAATGMHVSFVI